MCFFGLMKNSCFYVCDQATRRILAKPLIVCPNSLMRQWADELLKWYL